MKLATRSPSFIPCAFNAPATLLARSQVVFNVCRWVPFSSKVTTSSLGSSLAPRPRIRERISGVCCIVIGMLLTVLASFKKVARIAEIGLGLNVMTINQGDK